MCTLTYLPLSENSYILTSNRDEKIARESAIFPFKTDYVSQVLVYPKDPLGEGSWLVASSNGMVACLLNGGIEAHVSKPPYVMSRGKVLIHLFKFETISEFLAEFNFKGIEPFTIVAIKELAIHEIKWTGSAILHSIKDKSKAHIWSSVTLYSEEIRLARESFFYQYLNGLDEQNASNQLLGFHQFNGSEIFPNGIKLNPKNGTQTISISQIITNNKGINFDYFDLHQSGFQREFLEIQNHAVPS
ncbi:MAG: NRDE family protein [Bacteroidia bacterium]|nr:NRDE family protein [Bacteroidia bacterium]